MKVVVIGASGYVGAGTVSQLVDQSSSNEIIAVIRDIEERSERFGIQRC